MGAINFINQNLGGVSIVLRTLLVLNRYIMGVIGSDYSSISGWNIVWSMTMINSPLVGYLIHNGCIMDI